MPDGSVISLFVLERERTKWSPNEEPPETMFDLHLRDWPVKRAPISAHRIRAAQRSVTRFLSLLFL